MQRRCSGPGPARDGLTGSPGLDASHKLPSPPGPALTWVVCVRRDNGHPQALWFTPGLLILHSVRTSIYSEASPQSPGSEWKKCGRRKTTRPSRLPVSLPRAPNPQGRKPAGQREQHADTTA